MRYFDTPHITAHWLKERRIEKIEEIRDARAATVELERLIGEAIRLANKYGFRELEQALKTAEWEIPTPEDIE